MRFEVTQAVRIPLFWLVTLCGLPDTCHRFGETQGKMSLKSSGFICVGLDEIFPHVGITYKLMTIECLKFGVPVPVRPKLITSRPTKVPSNSIKRGHFLSS